MRARGIAEFSVRLRDQSLIFLQGAETGNEIRRETVWTDSYDVVILGLGRWPWLRVVHVTIHPDYVDKVLIAVANFQGKDGRPVTDGDIERSTTACRSRARE
jgi:hypothetical protein